MRSPRPSHPPPRAAWRPAGRPAQTGATHMQNHYCVHKLHGQGALITPPSSTHTLTHTHKATPTTRTLYIQYMGGGGEGYTIYDALADDPDDPADASAQGVLAGRGYTAPGRQGHPASGPGTMHASRAQPGPLAG